MEQGRVLLGFTRQERQVEFLQAVLSGDPYLIVKWDLSAESLAAGDYILVAKIEDSSGVEQEVGWKRAASTYIGEFFPFTVS